VPASRRRAFRSAWGHVGGDGALAVALIMAISTWRYASQTRPAPRPRSSRAIRTASPRATGRCPQREQRAEKVADVGGQGLQSGAAGD
jgi:hypothetical protein